MVTAVATLQRLVSCQSPEAWPPPTRSPRDRSVHKCLFAGISAGAGLGPLKQKYSQLL